MRTYERSESGDLREQNLRVRTLRASIGKVLAAPTTGWFKLLIGAAETQEINFDANGVLFKTAAEGSGLIETVENPATGTWVVKTTHADSEGPLPIYVHTNKLGPVSFVRVRQFKLFGVWWFECRLIQAPLAFNSGHERVLPMPPTVRRIRDGSAGSETEPPVNELQALHLPPDFRGTYFLRWNYRVSKLLGIEDGPDEIAAALNAMFGSGKRFEATNPEPDNAYVEFIGELGGSQQPLITVEVNTFAPGVLTFTLPLDRAEMAAALRTVAEIEVPFEVEAEIVDDGEDLADPTVPGRIITLFQQPVKVVREQIWDELATVQNLDWLRPPQPRDYIPFTPDQIIVGVQHYVCSFRRRRIALLLVPAQPRHRGISSHRARERVGRSRAGERRRLRRHDPERERGGARVSRRTSQRPRPTASRSCSRPPARAVRSSRTRTRWRRSSVCSTRWPEWMHDWKRSKTFSRRRCSPVANRPTSRWRSRFRT